MTRSPLFYPLNRGMDADAGGAADLQTDVMRFMAIISMCLVAIFALVQSIPLAPTRVQVETPPKLEVPKSTPIADNPGPAPTPEKIVITRPEPKRIETRKASPVLQRPKPKPIPRRPPTPAQQPPEPISREAEPAISRPRSEQKGFTLRFESDDALTRLVARNVVGFYAIGSDQAQRMSIDSGNIGFWAASAPGKIHEMEMATVPVSVLDAWRRSNGPGISNIKWGVSIPQSMSQQLSQYLTEQSGGALIIGADGALRLEQ